ERQRRQCRRHGQRNRTLRNTHGRAPLFPVTKTRARRSPRSTAIFVTSFTRKTASHIYGIATTHGERNFDPRTHSTRLSPHGNRTRRAHRRAAATNAMHALRL